MVDTKRSESLYMGMRKSSAIGQSECTLERNPQWRSLTIIVILISLAYDNYINEYLFERTTERENTKQAC